MTRTWQVLGAPLVAAALLACSSPAQAADPEKKDVELAKRLEKIEQRLKQIEDGMIAIQESADTARDEGMKIKLLNARIENLDNELKKARKAQDGNVKDRLSAYPQEALEDIHRRLIDIEKKMPSTGRVSNAAPDVGRLVLTNHYEEEITVVLNNRDSYRLLPGMARVVEGYPAGLLTYQVQTPTWGPRDRVTTTLPNNKTVRLTVD